MALINHVARTSNDQRHPGLMNPNIFTTLRFVMALLTLLAVAGKPHIPPKTLLLHPSPGTISSLYGPTDATGGEVATWLNDATHDWRCNYKSVYGASSCGVAFSWNVFDSEGCPSTLRFPTCLSADSDEDGDGWGWENEQSCLVGATAGHSTITQSEPEAARGSACDQGGSITPDHTAAAFRSVDFTEYDGLNVKIHYEGRAKFLRFYLRNLNPEHADHEDATSGKFMSAFLRTDDLKAGSAYVSLTEFSVEEWWILLHNPPRTLAAPEFQNIVTVGIDHVEHGVHRMRVDSIELVGERVSLENFLMGVLLFWAGFLLIEGATRYYLLYRSARLAETQINKLSGDAEQLEKEKDLLKTRSLTDPLTGAFNRTGMMQKLRALTSSSDLPVGFGLMVMDIDHFKKINDAHGHEVGDHVLQTLTNLIVEHIRDEDVFARWGGEEFVLITPYRTDVKLLAVAEKLRSLVASHVFKEGLELKVTISIGVAAARQGERFETTFKRADLALYTAKLSRNSVAFGE